MSTLILTSHSLGNKHEDLANVTVPVMRRYCERQGYAFDVENNAYDQGVFLRRLELTRKHLADHETVVFLDYDVLIMNHSLRIEEMRGPGSLTMARENLRWWPINNGVQIWRQGMGANLLLDRLILDEPIWIKYSWLWQHHIWNMIQEHPWAKKSISLVPAKQINATHQNGVGRWQLGDWAIHFLDFDIEDKIKLSKSYLPLIGKGDGTFYPLLK